MADPGMETARLPPPPPISAGEWSGASGKLYCRQHITKIHTSAGSEERVLLVHGLFLLQGVPDGSCKIKRLVPLPDIRAIARDHRSGRVVIYVSPDVQTPERDWEFKLSGGNNSHKSLEEIVFVINQCRQPLMPPQAPLLALEGDLNYPIKSGKRPGVLTAKERLDLYTRNPSLLPVRKSGFSPPVTTTTTPLDPPQDYWVELNDPEEDLGFDFLERAGKPAIIMSVTENGPLHRAGVPLGEIVKLNGMPTRTPEELKKAVMEATRNRLVKYPITVCRDPTKPSPLPYQPPVEVQPVEEPPMQRDMQPREVQESEGLTQSDPDESPDPEEVIAAKLQKAAASRRKGLMSDEMYQDTKDHYLTLLGGLRDPLLDDERDVMPQIPRTRAPPYPWGSVNIGRYIYLREGPSRETRWVVNGGVHGVLEAVHLIDDWCLVRADNGVEGYMRDKYLDFGPRAELLARSSRKKTKDESLRKHLSDIISEPGLTDRASSEFGKHLTATPPSEFFDPVARRWTPYSSRRAPSQASSWGPTATVRSSWQDPDTLYEASSRGDTQDIRSDELAWLTV